MDDRILPHQLRYSTRCDGAVPERINGIWSTVREAFRDQRQSGVLPAQMAASMAQLTLFRIVADHPSRERA